MSASNRRQFMQQSGLLAGASMLGAQPGLASRAARAGREDELRIALIGCGGRGTGAASQALSTAGPVRLVAVADAFADRMGGCLEHLNKAHPDRVDVPAERQFVGFDAFRKAIDCDVDVVVMATPPGFRPMHFAYAVEKGRHVFMEKPVAVDGPGIRQVLKSAELAKQKNLKVGVGLQRHHEAKYLDTMAAVKDGMIGDLRLLRCYWNSAGVWVRPRAAGQTEMEYQMRNWYYFNWLCGDHIVEQHIHNLDVCNWVTGEYPAKAQGQGGRQVRNGIDHGEIFDHHMVEYTYPSGVTMLSSCRHIPKTWSSVSEHATGTEGNVEFSRGMITRFDGDKWRFRAENPNPYQVEHDVLFAAIRADQAHNEADNGAKSTLTSIMGRMATYSGQMVTWEQALNSELALVPSSYDWEGAPPSLPDADGRYPIAMPGSTPGL